MRSSFITPPVKLWGIDPTSRFNNDQFQQKNKDRRLPQLRFVKKPSNPGDFSQPTSFSTYQTKILCNRTIEPVRFCRFRVGEIRLNRHRIGHNSDRAIWWTDLACSLERPHICLRQGQFICQCVAANMSIGTNPNINSPYFHGHISRSEEILQ